LAQGLIFGRSKNPITMWLTLRHFDSIFERSLSGFSDFPKQDDPDYEYSQETVESQTSSTTKETWKSLDGSRQFSRVKTLPKKKELNEKEIREKIKKAVEVEDYELASRLKRKLDKKGEYALPSSHSKVRSD